MTTFAARLASTRGQQSSSVTNERTTMRAPKNANLILVYNTLLFAMLLEKSALAWVHRPAVLSSPFLALPRAGTNRVMLQHNKRIVRPIHRKYSSIMASVEPDELKTLTTTMLAVREFGGLKHWNTTGMERFRTVFVLGGPGAGKGTQSELMEEHYPTVHLSVGQLLRDEQTKEDSPHRKLIEETLVAGRIVPVEISLQLLQNAMKEKAKENGQQLIFLVDGFPRNFDNLSGWCRCMKDVAVLWAVLVYQCPLEVLEERILERAKVSGRSDDNLSSVKKRFKTFETETMPVIDTMESASTDCSEKTWSVINIPGNQSLENVWLATQQVLNQLILHDVVSANAALLRTIETGDLNAYQELCDPEWFTHDMQPEEVMLKQEGTPAPIGAIDNAQLDVISGKHVALSYTRTLAGQNMREKRIWSHKGQLGWRNVHFARIPEA